MAQTHACRHIMFERGWNLVDKRNASFLVDKELWVEVGV